MERLLVEAENNLKAAAQRQGLLAEFSLEEMVWSLFWDDNAAAIDMAGGSVEVSPFSPEKDVYDNVVQQGRVFTRLWELTSTDASDVISKAKAMMGMTTDVPSKECLTRSALFFRTYIDFFIVDWGRSAEAPAVFNTQWEKLIRMSDHGFANTLLMMNYEIPAESNMRYFPKINNSWSRLFGIKQLPIAAHSRSVDFKIRKMEVKEDAKLKKAALRSQTIKDEEAAGGMYLPTPTLPTRHLESTGLHLPPLKPRVVMTLEVGSPASPLALTPRGLLVCRR